MELMLRYDFITSPIGAPTSTLIATALEQAAWADKKGFTTIQLPEHHGATCGYNPSPLTLAGAFAARTQTMRIHPILLLPFYDAVRLGEDLCMLDQASNGRMDVSIVLGYVPSEFEMFGLELDDRGRLADEKLSVLQQIFQGQDFDFAGRHGRVVPGPVQPGGPPLFIGGSVKASARRAARFGSAFYPLGATPELLAEYENACAALGKTPRVMNGDVAETTIYVTDDPDRAWAQVAPHIAVMHGFYTNASHSSGQNTGFKDVGDYADLRQLNRYLVLTPDDCIALCRSEAAKGNYIVICPLIGGTPPELSWPSLELFADKVLPALRPPAAA